MDLIKRDDAISAVDVFSNTASVLNLMELPAVDAIPKADYENRLKADMVAMLTEIQLEIDEMPMHYDPRDVSNLIQQKINTLKEQTKDPFTQAVSDSLVAFSKQVIENHEKEQNNVD